MILHGCKTTRTTKHTKSYVQDADNAEIVKEFESSKGAEHADLGSDEDDVISSTRPASPPGVSRPFRNFRVHLLLTILCTNTIA